jgi:hypothetical protein
MVICSAPGADTLPRPGISALASAAIPPHVRESRRFLSQITEIGAGASLPSATGCSSPRVFYDLSPCQFRWARVATACPHLCTRSAA